MLLPKKTFLWRRRGCNRRAFSLIELVVVLVIGGILLGLLVPALYSAQLGAGRRETANKLKWLCLSTHSMQDVFRKLAPAFDKFTGHPPLPVHVHLLPYIEEGATWKALIQQEGKGEAANRRITPFLAPDDPSNVKQDLKGIQNFAANLRVFATKGEKTKHNADMPALAGIEPGTAHLPRTFRDGTSNTIVFTTKFGYCDKGGSRYISPPNSPTAAFFGQNAARVKAHPSDKTAAFLLRPGPKDCCTSPLMAQSFYRMSIQVGLGDGSARQISSNITAETWNRAVQPNDGLPMPPDW